MHRLCMLIVAGLFVHIISKREVIVALYMRNKKLTLHIRIDKDMLDALSRCYQSEKLSSYQQSLTFSEYIRKILRVHVTR